MGEILPVPMVNVQISIIRAARAGGRSHDQIVKVHIPLAVYLHTGNQGSEIGEAGLLATFVGNLCIKGHKHHILHLIYFLLGHQIGSNVVLLDS